VKRAVVAQHDHRLTGIHERGARARKGLRERGAHFSPQSLAVFGHRRDHPSVRQ